MLFINVEYILVRYLVFQLLLGCIFNSVEYVFLHLFSLGHTVLQLLPHSSTCLETNFGCLLSSFINEMTGVLHNIMSTTFVVLITIAVIDGVLIGV